MFSLVDIPQAYIAAGHKYRFCSVLLKGLYLALREHGDPSLVNKLRAQIESGTSLKISLSL